MSYKTNDPSWIHVKFYIVEILVYILASFSKKEKNHFLNHVGCTFVLCLMFCVYIYAPIKRVWEHVWKKHELKVLISPGKLGL